MESDFAKNFLNVCQIFHIPAMEIICDLIEKHGDKINASSDTQGKWELASKWVQSRIPMGFDVGDLSDEDIENTLSVFQEVSKRKAAEVAENLHSVQAYFVSQRNIRERESIQGPSIILKKPDGTELTGIVKKTPESMMMPALFVDDQILLPEHCLDLIVVKATKDQLLVLRDNEYRFKDKPNSSIMA